MKAKPLSHAVENGNLFFDPTEFKKTTPLSSRKKALYAFDGGALRHALGLAPVARRVAGESSFVENRALLELSEKNALKKIDLSFFLNLD